MGYLPVRAAWIVLALTIGARSSPAQEPPVLRPLVVPPAVATRHEMLQKYVWSTLGIEGALHAAATGGFDQWRKNPPEWDSSRTGYAQRWASDYAESAIGDAAKYSVARIFHHDPSYTRCECTGLAGRLRHAVVSPFMARRRDGTRVLSAASLAGFLAGHVVSSVTWYPAAHGARDGLKHAGVSLVTTTGMDVFKEFRPRRLKKAQ